MNQENEKNNIEFAAASFYPEFYDVIKGLKKAGMSYIVNEPMPAEWVNRKTITVLVAPPDKQAPLPSENQNTLERIADALEGILWEMKNNAR